VNDKNNAYVNVLNKACEHCGATLEPRRRENTIGRIIVNLQCPSCGYSFGSSIPYRLVGDVRALASFDRNAFELWGERNRIKAQEDYIRDRDTAYNQAMNNVVGSEYQVYLKSERWQEKRIHALERDGYLCQSCRKARATEVHHLTYRHIFNEPLFDLTSVCHPCHERITEIDRTTRTMTAAGV
jgi:hypothetical protein